MRDNNQEILLRYWDSVAYARQLLGDSLATTFCERLKKLARTNTLDELKAIIRSWAPPAMPTEEVKKLNAALKTGANFRIPAHHRHKKFLGYSATGKERISSTDFVEDATQDAWVKLLKGGVTDDKEANVIAQTAAATLVRGERKYVPIPETHDGGDGEIPSVPPWDEVDASRPDYNPDPIWDKIRAQIHRAKQEELVRALGEDDFRFLMNYIAHFRLGRASRGDRDRAAAIKARLRRHFAKSLAGSLN